MALVLGQAFVRADFLARFAEAAPGGDDRADAGALGAAEAPDLPDLRLEDDLVVVLGDVALGRGGDALADGEEHAPPLRRDDVAEELAGAHPDLVRLGEEEEPRRRAELRAVLLRDRTELVPRIERGEDGPVLGRFHLEVTEPRGVAEGEVNPGLRGMPPAFGDAVRGLHRRVGANEVPRGRVPHELPRDVFCDAVPERAHERGTVVAELHEGNVEADPPHVRYRRDLARWFATHGESREPISPASAVEVPVAPSMRAATIATATASASRSTSATFG